jgi:hypothetical protein
MASPNQIPKGYAIHIGLNEYSKKPYEEAYESLPDPLQFCVEDAHALAKITKSQGFSEVITLTNAEATRKRFTDEMASIINKLQSGDLFVISFSGHGGQAYDVLEIDEGDPAHDGRDEFWCFYDDILIDDIFYRHLCQIKTGVRVHIIADSCHSGGMSRAEGDDKIHVFKLSANKFTYENRFDPDKYTGNESLEEIQASMIFWGAVRSEKVANEREFSQNLVKVWKKYGTQFTYNDLYSWLKKISDPQFKPSRPVKINADDFSEEIPFAIT